MKEECVALAQHRMIRAKQTLAEGNELLAKNFLAGATNRFYYAAFYTAKALLALKELDSSKHSGVISLFQLHFVKPRLIDPQESKILQKAFDKRLDMDYEDFASLTEDEVKFLYVEVERFIKVCEKLLQKLTN